MPDLPPKLFFRIGEVAGLVGVEPHVLRYWEREFRSIRPTKSAKGQRVYSRKDVENLLRVRDLLYRDGFTIAGAKKKLHRGADDDLETEVEPASNSAPHVQAVSGEPAATLAPHDESPLSEPSPTSMTSSTPLREQLLALRSEVEEFLAELSGSTARPRPHGSGAPPPIGDRTQPELGKRAGEMP